MEQLGLLPPSAPRMEYLAIPDAEVRLFHGFLSQKEGEDAFHGIRESVEWRQDRIRFMGKEHPLPRLQQWYGDAGLTYTWSGIRMEPTPWSDLLLALKRRVEAVAKESFNTVLLNLYRTGHDTVAWHTDDEPELGRRPVIASVSVGQERDFVFRHAHREDVADVTIRLPHGSLLLMTGDTQASWRHSLPRRKTQDGPRINLTFRHILSQEEIQKRRSSRI